MDTYLGCHTGIVPLSCYNLKKNACVTVSYPYSYPCVCFLDNMYVFIFIYGLRKKKCREMLATTFRVVEGLGFMEAAFI